MGRKPNQLIVEFFERGQKLNDSSNRYAHTCRSCGEKFPKGRTDTLHAHLLKACPAMTSEDRERILVQMQDPQSFSRAGIGIGGSLKQVPSNLQGVDFFGGLETLAEAARKASNSAQQHQHTYPHRGGRYQSLETGDFLLSDDQLHQQEQHTGLDAVTSMSLAQSGYLPAVTNLPEYGKSSEPATDSAAARIPTTENSTFGQDSSSRPVEPEASSSMFDRLFPKRLRMNETSSHAIDPSLQEDANVRVESPGDSADQSSTSRRLSESQLERSFSAWNNALKPERTKARARFTSTRRKEVQDIRKQGACVRCRMLKKPCSGGTPCTSCKSVDTARLWKHPCIRTRIAEEFDLFAVGVYTKLAFQDVNQTRALVQFEPSSNEFIDATHFSDPQLHNIATFASMSGEVVTNEPIDPALGNTALLPSQKLTRVRFLNVDGDDILSKLEKYFKTNQGLFFNDEPSTFMGPTLKLAANPCENKGDPLLSRSLELWCATHALADTEAVWQIFYSHDSEEDAQGVSQHHHTPINPQDDPTTYRLVLAQLAAFTEKRAFHVARSLMNDLERSLLARTKAPQFETFLTGVIILNCVEKMCWLFMVWHYHLNAVTENPMTRHDETIYHAKGVWPASRPPFSFIEKAEGFCSLLVMLMRMRAIPPKIKVGGDGFLAAVNPTEGFQEWFQKVAVTHELLLERRVTEGDLVDSRSMELKYISMLLLEEVPAGPPLNSPDLNE